jgi:peptidase E
MERGVSLPPAPAPRNAEWHRSVVLLGAQRFGPTLNACIRELGLEGRAALVTAGWQDRELEDERLRAHIDCEAVNLRLYQRAEQVYVEDPELARAHREKQTKLRHKQDFYRVRLEHELDANHVIRQRQAPVDVLEEEEQASVAAIRALDAYHLSQCQRVHAEFEAALLPPEREAVARQREELRAELEDCALVCVAGGHVASLLNRMRLFGFKDLIGNKPVLAWSGGAMVCTERVVLFHDSPPQGPGASEVLDEGLGLVDNVVVLPHPETRLRLYDEERVSLFARRFDPALCLAMHEGSHVTFEGRRARRPHQVSQLSADGRCVTFSRGTA